MDESSTTDYESDICGNATQWYCKWEEKHSYFIK